MLRRKLGLGVSESRKKVIDTKKLYSLVEDTRYPNAYTKLYILIALGELLAVRMLLDLSGQRHQPIQLGPTCGRYTHRCVGRAEQQTVGHVPCWRLQFCCDSPARHDGVGESTGRGAAYMFLLDRSEQRGG
ncbi:hypothetical protein LINPERPRIM_LOCUS22650 [Linum perenne]